MGKNKRKYYRFSTKDDQYVLISKINDVKENSVKEYFALIINESHGGCCVVVRSDSGLNVEEECMVKMNKFGPIKSRIVWEIKLDQDITKLGIKFLDE